MAEEHYVTLDEAVQLIGMKTKGSLYYAMGVLGIQPEKFPLNKHAFISREDVQRIKDARDTPWKSRGPHGSAALSEQAERGSEGSWFEDSGSSERNRHS